MKYKTKSGFWFLIMIGILLSGLLLFGQFLSLMNYELAVVLGFQESVGEVGDVGISFAKGFAFGDMLFYLPLLVVGLLGLLKGKKWGLYAMFGSLSITVYWPTVHLYTIYIGRDAITLNPDKYVSFSILLPLLMIYGLWGMWYLYKKAIITMQ